MDEALDQVNAALKSTNDKPVFFFYKSAVLLASGKNKEAVLLLEKALTLAPKMLKKFFELNPASLQSQQIVDIVAKFKRNKTI